MNSNLIFHTCLFIFYTAVFLWAIFRLKFFEIEGASRKGFAFFFLLKVAAGIALTLVYTYYYTDHAKADIYRYFNDSKVISALLFTHPLVWLQVMTGIGMHDAKVFVYLLDTLHFTHANGNMVTNNTLIIRLISLLNYFSFTNIYINTLFFDFISFVGLTLLYKSFVTYMPKLGLLLFIPLFLMPSVVFWGSGLLKEGIIISGTGIYILNILKWNVTGRNLNVLWALIGLLLIAWVKMYIAGLLVLCTIFLPVPVSLRKWAGVYIVILIAAAFAGRHFCETIIGERNKFISLSIAENAGSATDTTIIAPTCPNLLSLLPSSLNNAILRPFIWDKGKAFQLIFACENSAVLLLLAFLLLRYFKFPKGEKRNLFFFCVTFSFLNYVLIGLTVPVLGAIVHYRIIAQIFLFVAVLMLVDDEIGGILNYRFFK